MAETGSDFDDVKRNYVLHQEKKEVNYYFLGTILFFELVTFIYIATATNYADATNLDGLHTVTKYYAKYQDVHCMIFIGFGLLMSFLRKNAFNSIGMTFLLGVMAIQIGTVFNGITHNLFEGHAISEMLNITHLIKADFAAGAVLISFGAVVGRVTHVQALWMLFFELIFYSTNSWLGETRWHAVDMGGSMFVHMFGCYFGLAFSYMIGKPKEEDTDNERSVYHSDVTAIIGTIFLWMYWPSFNGALAGEETHAQERVVINTVFSLCASCAASFFFSHFYEGRLDMVHIQNASLAGGVAVGSSSDLVIGPWAALVIGGVAGFISTTGYVYLTPKLNHYVYDVCGINNLHGMPGVLGAVAGAISASSAIGNQYGDNIGKVFPAMSADGMGRSANDQGLIQAAALGMTLLFSIGGGLITGFIINKASTPKKHLFSDYDEWEVPDEEFVGTYFAKEMRNLDAGPVKMVSATTGVTVSGNTEMTDL